MSGRTLFIVNPVSARRHKLDQDRFRTSLDRRGLDHQIVEWQTANNNKYDLQDIDLADFQRIVVVGGDGTVNEVLNATYTHGREYGLIPLGSGNGLGRSLGIPRSAEKALDIIEKGDSRLLDLGAMNERLFINVAGMGFDAEVAQAFGRTSRGFIGYVIEVVRLYFDAREGRYSITTSEGQMELDAFLISIANGDQWGNNFYIARGARFDDGLLDVVAMKKPALYQIPSLLQALLRRKNHKLMQTFASDRFSIERPNTSAVHFDGEPMEGEKSLEIRCIPGAVRVLC